MDLLTQLISYLLFPLYYLTQADSQYFWPTYLVSGAVAIGLYMMGKRRWRISLFAAKEILLPTKLLEHESSKLDAKMFFVGLYYLALQVLLIGGTTVLSVAGTVAVFDNIFGSAPEPVGPSWIITGITMFLVPSKTKGVEIFPVHTMQEERTNATFYTDVRLPDRYRVGEINGGMRVLGAALELEHGAGYSPGKHGLVDAVVEWARRPGPDGTVPIEDPATIARIARVKTNACLKELIAKRAMYVGVSHFGKRTAYGSMNKLFGSEAFQRDMSDLIDLTAPESLFHGKTGLGEIELGHRQGQISTIYGGTSEVHRSMIAEIGLGLPRSR